MARGRRRPLAVCPQLLLRVLPHRFEQVVPPVLPVLAHHQRFVHQPRHEVQHVGQREVGRCTDCLRRVKGERTCEYRQPPEDRPLPLGEQGIAPVKRAPERLLACGHHSAPPGEQAEAVVEAVEDLRGREHTHACRRQFKGEGNAGEAGADTGDGGGILRRQREAGGNGLCPGKEELHCRGAGKFV